MKGVSEVAAVAVLCTSVFALTACTAQNVTPSSAFASINGQLLLAHAEQLNYGLTKGLYIRDGQNVLGYSTHNRSNNPPFCTLQSISSPANNIAFDRKGILIVPNADTAQITLVKDAKNGGCGKPFAHLADPDQIPFDAASIDARRGLIVVANIASTGTQNGSLSVCTLAKGCGPGFRNPNMGFVTGVALSKNGDCWASAYFPSGGGTLTYFKRCSGSGLAATNFNAGEYVGTLDIDERGNLTVVSRDLNAVFVFSGCNPTCVHVGGPFPLLSSGLNALTGRLSVNSGQFAVTDVTNSQIDVYAYAPTSLTYEYSFSNGLTCCSGDSWDGLAFDPSSN